jgi:hypothetical protein
MMGISNGSLMGSWYLMYLVLAIINSIVFGAFTAGQIFAKTEMGMLFVLFLVFQVS